jgi:hypothetical protein
MLGPTKDFPEGKLNADDEGGLRMMISQHRGTVRIDFGIKVAWIALPPDRAEEFANVVLKHAKQIREDQNADKQQGRRTEDHSSRS